MPDATKNENAKPTFRLQPLPVDVPPKDPFKNDLLGRKDFAEALATSLASIEGACVIAVNGRWGTGKTTFISMFTQHLQCDGFTVVEINAWKTDYADAPLAAVSSAVEQMLEEPDRPDFKAAAAGLLRVVAPPLLRLVTQGLVSSDAIQQAMNAGLSHWADASLQRFEEHQKSLDVFRQTLARVAGGNGGRPLIVVVDELDRCRPTYAVEFLETIKHVFDVEGVVFVLAVNREQLDQSAAVLYGNAADPESYFRRFFDIELTLPEPDRKDLIRDLLDRASLPSDDTSAAVLVEFLAASPFGVRSLQQTIRHYVIVRGALLVYEHAAWSWMLPTLMILRLVDEAVYRSFSAGMRTDAEVADAIFAHEWANQIRRSRHANLFEASIILASTENPDSSRLLAQHGASSDEDSVAGWVRRIRNGYTSTQMLGTVSARIDMLDIR